MFLKILTITIITISAAFGSTNYTSGQVFSSGSINLAFESYGVQGMHIFPVNSTIDKQKIIDNALLITGGSSSANILEFVLSPIVNASLVNGLFSFLDTVVPLEGDYLILTKNTDNPVFSEHQFRMLNIGSEQLTYYIGTLYDYDKNVDGTSNGSGTASEMMYFSAQYNIISKTYSEGFVDLKISFASSSCLDTTKNIHNDIIPLSSEGLLLTTTISLKLENNQLNFNNQDTLLLSSEEDVTALANAYQNLAYTCEGNI